MMTFVYLNTFFPTIYKEMLINKFNMQCVSVVGGGGYCCILNRPILRPRE